MQVYYLNLSVNSLSTWHKDKTKTIESQTSLNKDKSCPQESKFKFLNGQEG